MDIRPFVTQAFSFSFLVYKQYQGNSYFYTQFYNLLICMIANDWQKVIGRKSQ